MDSTQPRMPDRALTDELRDFAMTEGAELFGVASAEAYERRFREKPAPSSFVAAARSVIVVGMPFEPGTVATVLRPDLAALRRKAAEELTEGSAVQPAGAERYFLGEENAILVRELSRTGYRLAKRLRYRGWTALHLPPCKQDGRFRTAPFYHTPAMYLAGLGTMGLNCCILTPQFGPRVFVTSIITDAPLVPGEPMEAELCTRCGLCVKGCPINALDGEGWKNPYACASYGCCSACIAICPIGDI
ncbi:MAG TPA: 4Fe-4S binding protein [Phycisphaerae bacterium]|nr:4Fe-4S binding protein [Phycisphaerae bacterium]